MDRILGSDFDFLRWELASSLSCESFLVKVGATSGSIASGSKAKSGGGPSNMLELLFAASGRSEWPRRKGFGGGRISGEGSPSSGSSGMSTKLLLLVFRSLAFDRLREVVVGRSLQVSLEPSFSEDFSLFMVAMMPKQSASLRWDGSGWDCDEGWRISERRGI